jgi:hypothetical protein
MKGTILRDQDGGTRSIGVRFALNFAFGGHDYRSNQRTQSAIPSVRLLVEMRTKNVLRRTNPVLRCTIWRRCSVIGELA